MPHIRGQFGADAVGLVQHRSALGQLVGQFALMPARGIQLGPQGSAASPKVRASLAAASRSLWRASFISSKARCTRSRPFPCGTGLPASRRLSANADKAACFRPGGQPEPQVRRGACGQNRQQYPEQCAFRPRSGQPPRQQKNHGLQQNPHTPTILSKFTLLIDCFENRLSLIFLKWQ